jgi:acyl-CoA synthetase (AMP-forming)/AMP-acid ligase II
MDEAIRLLTAPGMPFEIEEVEIRGGENLYCVEVEDVLYGHPEVTDAETSTLPGGRSR